jgi:glucosamine--fructose-6-phosphate aminotransferase (isomerizing)
VRLREPGHHMEQEIREQPQALARLLESEGRQVCSIAHRLRQDPPVAIVLVARGSSDNAALYGRYLFETLLRVPTALAAPSVVTLYGARLRFQKMLVIGLSQSGRSPDVVRFVRAARAQGAQTLALTNDPESPLAAAAEETLLLRVGPEQSIAATKTYTAQLTLLSLLGAEVAQDPELLRAHAKLPGWVERALGMEGGVRELALRYRYLEECIVTSRGYNYATAREAALKLQETCGLVAEALPSSDLLHGPIAVVERGFPLLVLAPPGRVLRHLRDVLDRLRRRHAETTVVSSEADVLRRATVPIPFPVRVPEVLSPHVYVVPMQWLSFHLARFRGRDPDRPRGLRKVTRVL